MLTVPDRIVPISMPKVVQLPMSPAVDSVSPSRASPIMSGSTEPWTKVLLPSSGVGARHRAMTSVAGRVSRARTRVAGTAELRRGAGAFRAVQ